MAVGRYVFLEMTGLQVYISSPQTAQIEENSLYMCCIYLCMLSENIMKCV